VILSREHDILSVKEKKEKYCLPYPCALPGVSPGKSISIGEQETALMVWSGRTDGSKRRRVKSGGGSLCGWKPERLLRECPEASSYSQREESTSLCVIHSTSTPVHSCVEGED